MRATCCVNIIVLGGGVVGIVRSQSQAMEFSFLLIQWYINNILRPLLDSITQKKEYTEFCLQIDTTEHTKNYPISILNEMFEDRISQSLCPV
jgi:hypothetical protein